ncbi:MAG: hydrolase [Spirochaetales bacterium]|nr:MAG: hydrolase [Spirochaetales bacterium]
MAASIPGRAEAYALLTEFNKSENLLKHGLTVEAVMRHFAVLQGEDPEKWGVIGLIHDLDYEQFPDRHCIKTGEILTSRGWPEDYIRAVVSHGWGLCSDVEPLEVMEKILFTIDELTGLITAVVYVRPSKSILDLEVKSVKKKWKEKSFAAGANREVILKGCGMLGMDLDDVIRETIEGMKKAAAELGLKGTG